MGTNNIGFTSKQIQELTQVVTTVFDEKTKPIKRDLHKIKSNLRIIINHFDKRLIDQDIRLEKVEKHAGIFPEAI